MSIDRQDIERKLDVLTDRARPLYADPMPIEAFKSAAVDMFCKHFDKYGWPTEMPAFTAIPPSISASDPLPMDGYAGYEVGGVSGLWRMRFGAMRFDDDEVTFQQ